MCAKGLVMPVAAVVQSTGTWLWVSHLIHTLTHNNNLLQKNHLSDISPPNACVKISVCTQILCVKIQKKDFPEGINTVITSLLSVVTSWESLHKAILLCRRTEVFFLLFFCDMVRAVPPLAHCVRKLKLLP